MTTHTLNLSTVIRIVQKPFCSQNNEGIKITTDHRYSVTCVWRQCDSVLLRKWRRNKLSFVSWFVSPAPLKYANAELSLDPQGAVASPCHAVPTLTRVWANNHPQKRKVKQCPQCHLLCQLATVKPTTSHSHFYKAACMWRVPSAVPSEVGVNPRPCQTTFGLEIGHFLIPCFDFLCWTNNAGG